jgi:multidrug efflux pump subunit AcrA (membrane-fusion protein)
VFLVLVVLGVVVATLVAYRIAQQQAAAVPRRQIESWWASSSPCARISTSALAYTADALPNKQVAIFAKVSGYIKRLGAEPGDFVREGQLLVEIEAPELNAAVEQARAAVSTAEANLERGALTLEATRANAANQEANLARPEPSPPTTRGTPPAWRTCTGAG